MNSFFKTIIAGWGAKKLGGGCLSTVLIFVLIYVALGQCSSKKRTVALNKVNGDAAVAFVISGKNVRADISVGSGVKH